jgi:hypothetical protein
MNIDEIKNIILKFSDEEKFMLLRTLERDIFKKRLNKVLKKLEKNSMNYDQINSEVENVRKQRYKAK